MALQVTPVSIQKLIAPVCFYYYLLCSCGEAAKFSSVGALCILSVRSLVDDLQGEEMVCVRASYLAYSSR